MVRVTNLENGRSIKLRVNDRGPFAKSRIIDVSEKAASLLGFQSQGTAKVKVEILAGESRRLANVAELGTSDAVEIAPAVPLEPVAVLTLGGDGSTQPVFRQPSPQAVQAARLPRTSPPPQPTGEVTQYPVTPSSIYVQVGAFARKHNAVRLRARLSRLGPSTIEEVRLEEAVLFRVRMGPLANVEQADRMLRILDGNGYYDSRIVVQ
jgi:rare lipoprotein A